MGLCADSGPFDFGDPCIRASWSALLPAIFVFILCVFSLPIPGPVRNLFKYLKAPFDSFLTLHEAEALDITPAAGDKVIGDEDAAGASKLEVPNVVLLWRALVFALVGLVEALSWLVVGSFRLINAPSDVWGSVTPCLIALSWLYTVIRPISHPKATPPYDLFSIYLFHLMGGVLLLGGVLYDHNVVGFPLPWTFVMVALSANIAVVIGLLSVVLQMPLAIPSNRVRKEDIVSDIQAIYLCPQEASL